MVYVHAAHIGKQGTPLDRVQLILNSRRRLWTPDPLQRIVQRVASDQSAVVILGAHQPSFGQSTDVRQTDNALGPLSAGRADGSEIAE
jgi:hypothetical protein